MQDLIKPVPAVGVVCWRGDEVLLIQRGQQPRKGEWSIPGGRLNVFEPLKTAAARELFEETGVTAAIGDLIEVYEIIEPGFHYILIDYVAEWLSGEPKAADDAAAAGFFRLEDALVKVSRDDIRDVIARAHALKRLIS